MHYLLIYDVVPDYVERRAAYRAAHLALARAAAERGELLLGGALADPVDGAMLLFQGDSPAAAEAFAKADPYVRNGIVTRWRVRKWTTGSGRGRRSRSSSPKFPPPPSEFSLASRALGVSSEVRSVVSDRFEGYRPET
jgi:uncharacterized protein YciI